MIKAIETRYKGYRFRSRLEARWAVFLDALSVKWEYEKEGYCFGIGNQYKYLPDFYLPEYNMYIEIKGTSDQFVKSHELLHDFSVYINAPLCVSIGQFPEPEFIYYAKDGDRRASWDFNFSDALLASLLEKYGMDYFSHYLPLIEFPNQSMKGIKNYETSAFELASSARFEFGEQGE